MDLTAAFAQRRSCRSYLTDALPDEQIRRICAAARRAPSAGNSWGLDLVVLSDRDDVDGYWDVTLPAERREGFGWPGLLRAPVLLLVVVNPRAYVERYAEPDKARTGLGDSEAAWPVPYWWVDAGAAIMAMLLAAASEDLGSLLFGVFDNEAAVRARFGIPADRRLAGVIALGRRDGGDRPSVSTSRRRPEPDEFVGVGHW